MKCSEINCLYVKSDNTSWTKVEMAGGARRGGGGGRRGRRPDVDDSCPTKLKPTSSQDSGAEQKHP